MVTLEAEHSVLEEEHPVENTGLNVGFLVAVIACLAIWGVIIAVILGISEHLG